eukprot:35317_1
MSTTNIVKCWGFGLYGQLGYGDTNNIGIPENQVQLGSGFIPSQITAGGYHTCALSTTDKVKCWGYWDSGMNRGDNPDEMGDNLLPIDLGPFNTSSPTPLPTIPTTDPTTNPTSDPTIHPTANPTPDPTLKPTRSPTAGPTAGPTRSLIECPYNTFQYDTNAQCFVCYSDDVGYECKGG